MIKQFKAAQHRGVEKWLSRQFHKLKFAGSIPAPATILFYIVLSCYKRIESLNVFHKGLLIVAGKMDDGKAIPQLHFY